MELESIQLVNKQRTNKTVREVQLESKNTQTVSRARLESKCNGDSTVLTRSCAAVYSKFFWEGELTQQK